MTKDVMFGLIEGLLGGRRQKGSTITIISNDRTHSFLIPTAKARKATDAAIKDFEARRAELEKVAYERLALARARANEFTGRSFKILRESDPSGNISNPITNFDIAEHLTNSGLEVSKSQVRLPMGPLKSFGAHVLQIAPHTDVSFEIHIDVVETASEKLSADTDESDMAPATVAKAIEEAEFAAARMCGRMDEVLNYMAGSKDRIEKSRTTVRAELAAEYKGVL